MVDEREKVSHLSRNDASRKLNSHVDLPLNSFSSFASYPTSVTGTLLSPPLLSLVLDIDLRPSVLLEWEPLLVFPDLLRRFLERSRRRSLGRRNAVVSLSFGVLGLEGWNSSSLGSKELVRSLLGDNVEMLVLDRLLVVVDLTLLDLALIGLRLRRLRCRSSGLVALRADASPSLDSSTMFEILSSSSVDLLDQFWIGDGFSEDEFRDQRKRKSAKRRATIENEGRKGTHCRVYLDRRRPPLPPLTSPRSSYDQTGAIVAQVGLTTPERFPV